MTRPKVSVLMPLYNCERYVAASITSVLCQSLGGLELIVVDDGSTDGGLEIARSFSDRRVKVVSSSVNRGISASRNRALVEAQGEYIAWLDSDDIALPSRLERQVAFLEAKPDVDVCYSNFVEIDPQGRVTTVAGCHNDGLPTEWLILWTNPIAQSTVTLRRSALPPGENVYDARKDPAEDYDLWTRLARVRRFHYLDEVLVHYRNLPTSAYHTRTRKALRESIEANRRLVEDLAGESAPPFHPLLTSFGGVLEQQLRADYFDIEAWYQRLFMRLASRFFWSPAVAERVERDIEWRLSRHLRGNAGVYFNRGTRRKLLVKDPFVAISLELHWAMRLVGTGIRRLLKAPIHILRQTMSSRK